MRSKRLAAALAILFLLTVASAAAFAAAGAEPEEVPSTEAAREERDRGGLATGLIALAAAIAIGATAIATGIAQSRIGAAGAGTIAERPESGGTILVLLAIPETMVILGFIVAVIVIFTL